MSRSHVTTSFALLSVLMLAGCAGKTARVAEEVPASAVSDVDDNPVAAPVAVEHVVPQSSESETVAAVPQTSEAVPIPEAGDLEIVFFDYDSSALTAEARRILKQHAEWLQENQEVAATIEGHCDERGSDEYNLALGERRAVATRDYLLAQGVSPNQLTIVSYGELRPAADGHDETAWERNRRVQFR